MLSLPIHVFWPVLDSPGGSRMSSPTAARLGSAVTSELPRFGMLRLLASLFYRLSNPVTRLSPVTPDDSPPDHHERV